MKNIFLLSLLLTLNVALSQTYSVLSTTSLNNATQELDHTKNGNYAVDTNNERDQYLGTWEYNNNGTVFQIKIEKRNKTFNGIIEQGVLKSDYFFMDEVIIRYKLIINGQTKYDNFAEVIPAKVKGSGFKLGQNNYLHGSIVDESVQMGIRFNIFKTTSNNPQTIVFKPQKGTLFKLRNYVAINNNGLPTYIPLNEMTMNKIN